MEAEPASSYQSRKSLLFAFQTFLFAGLQAQALDFAKEMLYAFLENQ